MEPSVDFDFDSIDGEQDPPLADIPEESCQAITMLARWLAQHPTRDLDGVSVRAVIIMWVFDPAFARTSMTDMAKQYGKKKQSIDRWFQNFRRKFPCLQRIKNSKEWTDENSSK